MTNTPNLGLTQYAGTDTMNFLTQYNTDLDKIDDYSVATNTNIGTLASLKTAVKTSTVGAINEVYDTTDNGWISARATLTYSSADAPTFVCNTNIDLTSRISVGMKIKLTQTTTKYFFVTAITSTTITLYGGTDYVVANATISNVYFSVVKSPFGFPMNPNKWSVTYSNSADITTAIPIINTWYNSGNSLNIPIGCWDVQYKVCGQIGNTGDVVTERYSQITFSSSASAITNPEFNTSCSGYGTFIRQVSTIRNSLTITQSTIFYLIYRTLLSVSTIYCGVGSEVSTAITATCAYL